mmetsp:Transcript_8006/g.12869  ORF Transcript_8006/g.12869 Transcript_8006/m.12869 type:complete len:215 (+) Transcript_8006:16-660(+)|eukprot:CAMPEP_0201929402 /NCGR_PEP_ID=MMETSP0903-20130614/22946_1 /ASSEMBLY_ACC=CAM_ASM_000552 /TAXON_ID=420261 /ORGANISM="Thalassiosira antarctica, Strain CCMP982" /LENGTH=214 /DNA_ID=CAMNT_0048468167 /DNA_START=155 /DNA_END=799 /DNA_ORIENTATION=+
MTFPSPSKGGQQCPPPPPSSPTNSLRQSRTAHHSQQQDQPQPLPQQQIANLLQYAQTSYTTNPTDALSAIMNALTLTTTTGPNAKAQHAMHRIRSELGDAVADCVAGNAPNHHPMHHSTSTQQQHQHAPSEREMTLRMMSIVEELLNDTSTILYAQGKQHLLQQAMEDGSSVVCNQCGDVVSRERWAQHAEYWCRAVEEEEKDCDDGESMAMDE